MVTEVHKRFADMCSEQSVRLERLAEELTLRHQNVDLSQTAATLRALAQDITSQASLLDLPEVVQAGTAVSAALRELALGSEVEPVYKALSWCRHLTEGAAAEASGQPPPGAGAKEALRALLASLKARAMVEVPTCEASHAELSPRPRILILDDSEITRDAMASLFAGHGYPVETVADLAEFEQKLASFQPQVILTDVQMPEIQGDEICRVLKSRFRTRGVPILLVSSLPIEELSARASRAGADGHVSKQEGPEQLVTVVEQLLTEIVF